MLVQSTMLVQAYFTNKAVIVSSFFSSLATNLFRPNYGTQHCNNLRLPPFLIKTFFLLVFYHGFEFWLFQSLKIYVISLGILISYISQQPLQK